MRMLFIWSRSPNMYLPLGVLLLGAIQVFAGHCGTGSCSGKWIDSYNVKHGSTVYAVIDLYLDASKGQNCAKMTKKKAVGSSTWMDLFIGAEPKGGTDWTDYAVDDGNFASYAGPCYVKAPKCVFVWGKMGVGSVEAAGGSSGDSHCSS